MNIPVEMIEDKNDYTSMFEMLNLNQNQNGKNIFYSIMDLLKVDTPETDSIRLLLACTLTDPNKLKELSK